jgi:hypothetical protein
MLIWGLSVRHWVHRCICIQRQSLVVLPDGPVWLLLLLVLTVAILILAVTMTMTVTTVHPSSHPAI